MLFNTFNNSSLFPSLENGQSDSPDDAKLEPIYSYLSFITSIAVAISSPVAVVGNALTIAVIWRSQSLKTPSYILLGGLALTDFCTGLINEPLYIAYKLTDITVHKMYTIWFCNTPVVQFFGMYFAWLTLLNMTFMAIERWLHMARSSLLTVRRVCFIFGLLILVPVPIAVAASSSLRRSRQNKCLSSEVDIATEFLALLCCVATSVAYFKVFRIIRAHQNHVYSSQNFNHTAIDLLKYKKSVSTILYILLLFYSCFLPAICFHLLNSVVDFSPQILFVATDLSVALLLISSSLNPFLCCWRITELRRGVKQLIRTKLLREND